MEKNISRRDLLKAIIAGSCGIMTAGFIPEKWLKPVVKSGVLSVHAQASSPEPTLQATPSPTPVSNFIEGRGQYTGFLLYADAYVSAVPFEFPLQSTLTQKSHKLASPLKGAIPTNQPVEGIEVTLIINEREFPEKKTTDTNGYVLWEIDYWNTEWSLEQSNALPKRETTKLKFVIDGDEDFCEIPLSSPP